MIYTIDELRELIHQHKLERWEEKIVSLAKPAIAIQKQLTRGEDDIPLGASKIGGNPDLPQGIEWSFYQGKPLTFIAQFKLSEIAPFDVEKILPERGMLYFFYEIEESHWSDNPPNEGWKIIYIEDETRTLFRTPHPIQQGERRTIQALHCSAIAYVPYLNLPLIYKSDESDDDLDFTDDEIGTYRALLEIYEEPAHRLLGNPVQALDYPTPEWECVIDQHHITMKKAADSKHYRYSDEDLAFLRRERKNWQFLFQIDTDRSLKIDWGNAGGILYVCIPKESLRQRKFDDCWTNMQSS